MTRVRMLDTEYGRFRDGEAPRQFLKGQEYDVPDQIAASWFSIGLAVLVQPGADRAKKG